MNIKPCPFCNSDAVLKVIEDQIDYCYDKKTGKVKEYYDVKCTNEDCYLSYGADWNHPNPEEMSHTKVKYPKGLRVIFRIKKISRIRLRLMILKKW